MHRVLSETKARRDRSLIYTDVNEDGDYAEEGEITVITTVQSRARACGPGDPSRGKASKLRSNLFLENDASLIYSSR